jgi:hypothetical protein
MQCCHSHRWIWTVGLAVVVACWGCADPKNATLTGNVTLDGAAVPQGSISFFPVDGKGSTAGGEIVDGKYSVQVPFGTSRVEIRVAKVTGQKKLYDTPDSPVQNVLSEVLPPRYNDLSELQVTVEKGKKAEPVDFDLTLKDPKKK